MNEWINVKDRLPEDDTMVLVTAQAKNGHRSVNRAFTTNWAGTAPGPWPE